ncbi:MAG TPA: acetylxylan esterase [Opitutaceae bacterium]|nr:acetylxylan esterase [Opitutaceae bacterium]
MNHPAPLTRRALLQKTGLALAGVQLAGPAPLLGAAAPAPAPAPKAAKTGKASSATPPDLAPLNRFPRMMHEYFLQRVTDQERATDQRRAALKSKSDAEAFIRERAEKARRCFGPLPPRTPLNPRVTGRVERDTYAVENVIFESRPNFPVTGNLYLPRHRSKPLPAVVGVCGHSANGKAGGTYQSFAQGLARLGYIVLLIDPAGQGERLQCVDANLKPTKGASTSEHNYLGNQQLLVGEFLGTWQAWDGIRALDYLLTRPEVNPKQVMVTGNSGGGTITTWMCALEPRFLGAAPSCFVNTFRRLVEHEEAQDAEQCPPHTLAFGLNHSDFFLPFLPRSLILMGQEGDFFDARGLEQAHGQLKPLYALMGAPQNLGLFVGPDPHGYHLKNREAMYGWFNQLTQASATNTEPPLTLEKDETLQCTERGQVAAMNAATVVSFTNAAARDLKAKRRTLAGEALRRAVAGVLALPQRGGVPDYRILPPPPNRRYPKRAAGNYAVETEPGILNIVYRLSDTPLVSRPPRGAKSAVLYVAHRSADAELRDEPLVRELLAAQPAAAFYACDLRGIGESQPNTTPRAFTDAYGSDYFYATYGVMSDWSYPAQRTFDVLRLVDWLKANGHDEIHLAAKGWGAIPATFAALLDDRITRVTLKHALSSYTAVAEATEYELPLSSMVPEVLKTFDLPECYRALEPKGLRQIEPRGATA